MSVEIRELQQSRSFSQDATSSKGTWKFIVRVIGEASPEDAAMTSVLAAAPFFWEGLSRQSVTADNQGAGLYLVDVPYSLEVADGAGAAPDPTQTPGATSGPGGGAPSAAPPGPATENDPIRTNVSMEIGGRPPKIIRSIETLYKIGLNGDVPADYMKAINVGEDGKVEGCEIPDASSTFTIDMQLDFVSWKYIKLLQSMVWKCNDAAWFTISTYSVAFMGASLKTNEKGRVDVSFKFGASAWVTIPQDAIRTGLPAVADAPLIVPGWHYLWLTYVDEIDIVATKKRTVRRPNAMYVERVLETADFALLGIGG